MPRVARVVSAPVRWESSQLGPSRTARSSSRSRSSDLTAALARWAASSVSQETTARLRATSASSPSGSFSAPAPSPRWKAPTTISAISIACAMTSPAPTRPSATEAARKKRVARAYRSSRGSIGFT